MKISVLCVLALAVCLVSAAKKDEKKEEPKKDVGTVIGKFLSTVCCVCL